MAHGALLPGDDMNTKKMIKYVPDSQVIKNVLYLKDADGLDWYESIDSGMWAEDSIKIAYDDNGVIRHVDDDVSKIWPIDLSVVEVAAKDAPAGLNHLGGWLWDGKKISAAVIDNAAENEVKKSGLMAKANLQISIYQNLVNLNLASTLEKEALAAWIIYKANLSAVKASAKKITWPEVPA